jgi:hypothetical protein
LEKIMDLLQQSAWHLRSIYAGGSVLMKADENTASTPEARRPRRLSREVLNGMSKRSAEPGSGNTRHKTDSHPFPHFGTPLHMDSLPDTFQLPIFKS